MNQNRTPRYRLGLVAIAAGALAACASAPGRNAALDDAKAAYERTARDPQVARSAPVELRKAQQAIQQAESALRAGEDPSSVEHYAYVARQRTEVALQAGIQAQAEQAVADASLKRDSILIDARTREAEAQRSLAEKARLDADAQRKQADAQRSQAEAARKLAEERLAAAQASRAQAASARARAKTLEEQLTELKAKQTERGMVLTLGDVLFDTGRAQLNPGSARTLDQLASFLKDNPDRTIDIEGHTDAAGTDASNQVLSERRAIAVKNALIDRGIAANRLAARGFGEARPVASNDHAAGRQQNRRVEIVFSGKP
ncbi:MAG: OmpA family protein [Burkholderiaceae bacterium]|nr:OmpA family protein [Burkholderiaceae bacterium]